MSNLRKATFAALTGLVVVTSLATTSAEARPRWRHHHHWGPVAAGLIIGGIAATAASASYAGYGECYRVRRWVETPYGMVRRTVRVCD